MGSQRAGHNWMTFTSLHLNSFKFFSPLRTKFHRMFLDIYSYHFFSESFYYSYWAHEIFSFHLLFSPAQLGIIFGDSSSVHTPLPTPYLAPWFFHPPLLQRLHLPSPAILSHCMPWSLDLVWARIIITLSDHHIDLQHFLASPSSKLWIKPLSICLTSMLAFLKFHNSSSEPSFAYVYFSLTPFSLYYTHLAKPKHENSHISTQTMPVPMNFM